MGDFISRPTVRDTAEGTTTTSQPSGRIVPRRGPFRGPRGRSQSASEPG